jgi:hypothetical protein
MKNDDIKSKKSENEDKKKRSDNNFYIGVTLIAAVAVIIYVAWSSNIFLSPYERYYAGDVRHFRGNLYEADKVPVYPNELSLINVLLNPEVYRIQVAFFPNDTENSYYYASSFEITNKLSIIFRNILGGNVTAFKTEDNSSCLLFYPYKQIRCFKSIPINSTDEISSSSTEPVILLVGPSRANRTAVSVDNYLVTAEGYSFQETNRTYTDLDLSVDKIILVLMDYTSS